MFLTLKEVDMSLVDLGYVKGPKGDTGATGATGPQGPKGDTGSWSGASTLIYSDGATINTSDTPIS